MSKYIDADKLIAEIMALKEKYGSYVAKNEVEKCYKGGRLIGYEDALNKINKLQQEQPVCETLGQEIEKAWKPYDQLGFDLTKSQFADIARHFAMWGIHTAESCKVEEFKQEQPEVDLEKEIDAFFDKWDKNSNGGIFDENGAPVTIKTIKGAVKHFLNARNDMRKSGLSPTPMN